MFYSRVTIIIFAVGFFVFIPFIAYAVPAAPFMTELKQPDGTTFKARQWGDENLNGWETAEGYTIVFDEKLKGWTYADHDPDGNLVSSGLIVRKDIPPSAIKKRLRPKDKALSKIIFKKLSRELKASLGVNGFSSQGEASLAELVVPSTGTGYIPTILINFNDRVTTYTPAEFNTSLFSTGNYSMKDYYQEVSYGAFSVSAGPGGVVGWYTAANGHDYYGTDVSSSGDDAFPGDLVYEAVAAADSAGFNFAPYDQDGDCYVDVVNIIHQGSGQEASGISTDIWSHRWNLNSANFWGRSHYSQYVTNDPCPAGGFIKVNDYVIQPETYNSGIQTIGVFAHEYGHALGLPDLYDTDYSSAGIGRWSLMAGGSWNYVTRPGDRPAHMDAWCKYKLGWVTPTAVSGMLINEPIEQAATNPDVYRLLSGTSSSGEYFLVENRQKAGFDAGLPGAGLLIWHIEASQATNNNECYPGGPSCALQHYKVALVQADNLWELEKDIDQGDTGDPYPGSTNNTAFNASSSPNSNLYNGLASSVSVTSISASGSTMTATLTVGSDPGSSLGEAVDNTVLSWVTGGNTSWFSQTSAYYYGGDAAQSGDINDNQSSWIETEVTGPGILTFYWKVSSESGYDHLIFYANGVEQTRISGEVNWQQKAYLIPTGTYALRWTYIKDFSLSIGSDAGWLDYVAFTPQYTLTITKAGTGSGTVTSNPTGINCGADCSELYNYNTVVTLTATADAGSTFAGWSGDADCSDGVVTIDANKTCTATFTFIYDHFDDYTYTDRWAVDQSGTVSIIEDSKRLRLSITKPLSGCSYIDLSSILSYSGENLFIEAGVKIKGGGEMLLRLRKDDENFVQFGVNMAELPNVIIGSSAGGVYSEQNVNAGVEYYIKKKYKYKTFSILKTGYEYKAYLNGIKIGETVTNASIGDNNLTVKLLNTSCATDSKSLKNEFDYVFASETMDDGLPAGSVVLLAPNGGEAIRLNSIYLIEWDAPVTAVNFNIEYSVDNGLTWRLIDTGIQAKAYTWKVQKVKALSNYLLRITGYDSLGNIVGSDTSDSAFSIVP